MGSVPLAQSADKKDLFARLGLNEQIHRILLVRIRVCLHKQLTDMVCVVSKRPRPQGTP